jgi:hypothetical protein
MKITQQNWKIELPGHLPILLAQSHDIAIYMPRSVRAQIPCNFVGCDCYAFGWNVTGEMSSDGFTENEDDYTGWWFGLSLDEIMEEIENFIISLETIRIPIPGKPLPLLIKQDENKEWHLLIPTVHVPQSDIDICGEPLNATSCGGWGLTYKEGSDFPGRHNFCPDGYRSSSPRSSIELIKTEAEKFIQLLKKADTACETQKYYIFGLNSFEWFLSPGYGTTKDIKEAYIYMDLESYIGNIRDGIIVAIPVEKLDGQVTLGRLVGEYKFKLP